MVKLEQSEAQAVLRELDQAIAHHTQWFHAITRGLVCHLSSDPRDIAADAHHHCRLGQWYYGAAPAALRTHPGFIALEADHRRMHQMAAKVLQAAASGLAVTPSDFDAYAGALEQVRTQLEALRRELEDTLYNIDALTGAQSRVGMLARLREQRELVRRQVQSCVIAMMDIDHFKVVNDTWGHPAGDRVLAAAAHYAMEHFRPYDKLFRYGGEEFLVCMPNTDAATGYEVVERVRRGLEHLPIAHEGHAPLKVTMSFGVAVLDPDVDVEQSIERADKAMYAAKAAGRNCTRVWDPSL